MSPFMFFTPTQSAAQARMQAFAPHMARTYAAQRNHDHGPSNPGTDTLSAKRNNVSTLSPWIRHRLLTEEALVARVLETHSQDAAEKFLSEILWRAYFRGWMELRPTVWADYVADRDAALAHVAGNAGLRKAYDAAISGNTGIDAFDAFARELAATNYLHNHARMWFASIWIFTLKLPWVLGADFFLQHLIDGDAASNTCSWRWVGGLHTIGKTYLARASNIAYYTDGRFDPQGLAAFAAPLADPRSYPVGKAPTGDRAPDGPYVLLVHADDCTPETLPLSHPPSAVILIDMADPRSPLGTAAVVQEFASGALTDTGARAAAHWGCAVHRWTPDDHPHSPALSDMIKTTGIGQVAMAWLPTGSLHDALTPHLANVPVSRILRTYDADTWPYATKGFFHLRQKSQTVIDRLAVPDLFSFDNAAAP